MAYFVIKNVTNKLDKRHPNVNQALEIEYFSQFEKKFHSLGSGREMVINADNLPLGVHILKAKNLITVKKISNAEYEKTQKPKQIQEKKPTVTTTQNQVDEQSQKKEKKKPKKIEDLD